MKKLYLIFALFISAVISTTAQDNNGGRNDNNRDNSRLQAYKIAFLTKKLDLSPDEAQKFWPVYNKYEAEIRSERIDNHRNNGNEIETEERILNIRKKYNGEFAKVLSAEKVNTLYRSEREFGNIVQKELMQRRQKK